jgi:hypothetical protein
MLATAQLAAASQETRLEGEFLAATSSRCFGNIAQSSPTAFVNSNRRRGGLIGLARETSPEAELTKFA